MSVKIENEEYLQCPECEHRSVIVDDAYLNVEGYEVTIPMYCDYCENQWEVVFEFDHVNQL